MTEEFPDVEMRVGLASRLLAAVWFAFTACIPIVYFFGVYERTSWSNPNAFFGRPITLFIVLPICLAAFFGFTIGSKILDEKGMTPGLAALLGALVAIASYCGMMIGFGLVSTSNAASGCPNPLEVIAGAIVFALFGMVFVGWLVVLAGAASGWLLFLWADSDNAPSIIWVTKDDARRFNYVAGAALFVALSFCLLTWLACRS
ncbi:MAG TPA: hypothetical protein VHQ64_18180 [Pyrinomonadaceae bacterium]|jgi:hypothetical protein|nr:hypothetical protein [Pyrinomonadaceae bacterium]